MSVRLYVGNLPKESIERDALQSMFVGAEDIMSTKVIKDRKTGKCRGFAFVTVSTDEIADAFIEKYNGQSFMDSPLKIEKALPRSKDKEDEDGSGEDETTVADRPAAKMPSKKVGNKKKTRSQSAGAGSDGFQPDPRWADELAKLKEMLVASSD
jgi:RNA recognition motif-containing protein